MEVCWAAPHRPTSPVLAWSRLKKEPRISNRDINGLIGREWGLGVAGKAYISEARTWNNTPPCAVDTWWGMVAIFTPGSKGHLPGIGELRLGGLVSYQGNRRGHAPHSPFDKNNY